MLFHAQPVKCGYNQLMSYLNDELKRKKVLVTGATGFIGGRLAQRLAEEEGAIVTGTGRNLDKVPFLREAGVSLQAVDLRDEVGLREVVAGQDVIFHVAAWLGGGRLAEDEAAAFALNVTATETLLRLAKEANVSRFVLVSSITVYGIPDVELVDETAPLDTLQDDLYGRTKAQGDQQAQATAAELGLDLAIVRPGLVYGPRSQSWTIGMVKLVQAGTPVIFGEGDGHAFPVYIDNVVDCLLLTAVHPAAVGEAFNVCDAVISWREFFEEIGRLCAKKPRSLPLVAARILAWANGVFKLGLPLNKNRLAYLTQKNRYASQKAEKMLGYQARVSLAHGRQLTEEWLRVEGLI